MGAGEIKEQFAEGADATGATALEIEVVALAKLRWPQYLAEHRAKVATQFKIPKVELDKLVKAEIAKQKEAAREAAAAQTKVAPNENTKSDDDPFEDDGVASESESEALYEAAKPIAESDDILAEVDKQLVADGYAGNTAPALRSYVTICSRFFDRPINLHRIAPASSGKNYSIDAVLPYFPPDAYYKLTASSEKALIYIDEPMQHRIVLLDEADSLPKDGPAASVARSIAHEGKMVYVTVERDPDTQQYVARRIEREGPTGIITTGVKSLEPQMATRFLTDGLLDDATQTRLIMQSQGKAAQGEIDPNVAPLEPFVAFQKWLALKGERRVVVPFASVLADIIPADQVRMRRDFPKLLTTIKVVAFISQVKRTKDDKGRVVASLADYEAARELLAPVYDVIVADGVTTAVRETVEAIGEYQEVSLPELMTRLNLKKTAAWARVNRAIRGGYLSNIEDKKGRPARLQRGLPLPEKQTALPSVAALEKEIEKRSSKMDEDAEIDRLAKADGEN